MNNIFNFFSLFFQAMAECQREEFRESFKGVQYFCATSDIWSRSNRSFIAVTVHYFENNTLEIRSKFVACEHFPGRHTHDRVASKLKSILERFNILDRVNFVTTDGAGEYTAAFKYFGQNYRSVHLLNSSEESLNLLDRSGDDAAIIDATDESSRSSMNSNENSAWRFESDSEDDPDGFVRSRTESTVDESFDDDDSNMDPDSFRIHASKMPRTLLANMNRILNL